MLLSLNIYKFQETEEPVETLLVQLGSRTAHPTRTRVVAQYWPLIGFVPPKKKGTRLMKDLISSRLRFFFRGLYRLDVNFTYLSSSLKRFSV